MIHTPYPSVRLRDTVNHEDEPDEQQSILSLLEQNLTKSSLDPDMGSRDSRLPQARQAILLEKIYIMTGA